MACRTTPGSRWRGLIGAAALAVACGLSSPAWCGSHFLIIADTGNDRLVLLPQKDLKKSNSGSGALFLDELPSPVGVALDKKNNLWVSVDGNGSAPPGLQQYTPTQLYKLRTIPTPVVHISLFGEALYKPGGLAFDRHGTLWEADASGTVNGFNSALLSGGSQSNVTPTFMITCSAFNEPTSLTFDKDGDMWTSNVGASTLVEIKAIDLSSSGLKVPAVILSNDGSGSLDIPGQAAFDQKGNLYVPNLGNATIAVFGPNQLSTSGAPTPNVTLSGLPTDDPFAVEMRKEGEQFFAPGPGDLFEIADGNGFLYTYPDEELEKSESLKASATVGPIFSDEPGQMTFF